MRPHQANELILSTSFLHVAFRHRRSSPICGLFEAPGDESSPNSGGADSSNGASASAGGIAEEEEAGRGGSAVQPPSEGVDAGAERATRGDAALGEGARLRLPGPAQAGEGFSSTYFGEDDQSAGQGCLPDDHFYNGLPSRCSSAALPGEPDGRLNQQHGNGLGVVNNGGGGGIDRESAQYGESDGVRADTSAESAIGVGGACLFHADANNRDEARDTSARCGSPASESDIRPLRRLSGAASAQERRSPGDGDFSGAGCGTSTESLAGCSATFRTPSSIGELVAPAREGGGCDTGGSWTHHPSSTASGFAGSGSAVSIDGACNTPIRRAEDFGGGAHDGCSSVVLFGRVGGVRRKLGILADQRGARDSNYNLGAAEVRAEHGCVEGVAGDEGGAAGGGTECSGAIGACTALISCEQTPTSVCAERVLSKRGRKPTLPLALSTDARCQNRRCLATASRTVELSNELSNLRAEFERRLDRAAAARVKKAEAEAAECKRELEQLRIDERRAHIHRNRSDALVKRVTIKAAAQIDAATRDTAFAKSELASTMRKLLDEKEETRRLRRELGTARAQATKLQSKIQEGERDLDEALDAVAEEEWRAASAVEALQELTRKAEVDAQAARDSILQEMGTATALEEERDSLLYDIKLLDLKLSRLHARNDQLLAPPPAARAASMDERVQHSRDAEKKRRSRRRIWLKGVLKDYKYDMAEVAAVAGDLELTANLFDTKEVFTEHIARVRKLMETVGREHLGQAFALFLHFDMHLPLEKIARVNNAGCMRFHRSSDSYSRIVIAHNPYVKADVVKMPRLTPPRCRLEHRVRQLSKRQFPTNLAL